MGILWYNVRCYTVLIALCNRQTVVLRLKRQGKTCVPHIVGKRIKNFGETHALFSGNANLRF